MNIYLLRHGETEENKNKYYYGKLNVELNETGKLQAEKAGEMLKGIKFDSIYISERKRTRETALLALGNKQHKFMEDSRINEINFGEFEGKNYKEIQEKYPLEYEEWNNNWQQFAPPGGESYQTFYLRVESFIKDLLEIDNENILIVTHGGVVRSIYCYVLGGNLDFYWKFASRNGDISLIRHEYGNIFIDSITHV